MMAKKIVSTPIGAALLQLRLERNLTQNELGSFLNSSGSNVSRVELGKVCEFRGMLTGLVNQYGWDASNTFRLVEESRKIIESRQLLTEEPPVEITKSQEVQKVLTSLLKRAEELSNKDIEILKAVAYN